jgi:hypothetical protein
MAKTTQVMKIDVCGAHFVCTFTPSRRNPYQLYRKTWEQGKYGMGWHQRRIAEYANFESVMWHLSDLRLPEFRRDWFGDMT